jgi:hypothetical protein
VASERADGILAIELERTLKGRARLRRILHAYVAARHVGAVRYYAARTAVERMVKDELHKQRAHSLVEVRSWSAASQEGWNRGPGPG